VQFVVTAIILWFVAVRLIDEWRKFRVTPTEVHPRWGLIVLSGIVVLTTYAVLVETWRRIVVGWGEQLGFIDAARIWSVSTLVRYLPWNQVFQVGAFAELARRQRISPPIAAGAALINTAVNIATGFVVALVAGWAAVDTLSNGHAVLGVTLTVILFCGLLALPMLLPHALEAVHRMTGRSVDIGTLPHRALYQAVVGNLIAWVLYGIAFQLFVAGILGEARGSTADYVAVWAVAYVLGYLAFAMPAGLGARELALVDALSLVGLATVGQAAVVAVTARLWVTVLEIVPALIFLARGTRRRPATSNLGDGSNS
jgi:hypothetical protein